MIEGFTVTRHNISSICEAYSVCLFFIISSRQKMNIIWQLSNDVNFMNDRKQKKCGNESPAFDFFKLFLSFPSL